MRSVIAIALLVVACGGTLEPSSATATATASPSPTSPLYDHIADLPIGQCFDPIRDRDDQLILAARLRSCDEPHLGEVTGQRALPYAPEAAYPGDSQVEEAAESECRSAFEDYVGTGYDLSRLQGEYSWPGADTWAGGDRGVTCLVIGTEAGPLVQSVKGSRQ
jgi:hypothetical protein